MLLLGIYGILSTHFDPNDDMCAILVNKPGKKERKKEWMNEMLNEEWMNEMLNEFVCLFCKVLWYEHSMGMGGLSNNLASAAGSQEEGTACLIWSHKATWDLSRATL